MNSVSTEVLDFTKLTRAIVMFGPPEPNSGFRPATYYQVVIDPNMTSPEGDYIRFDQQLGRGDEIHGWQRVDGLTVCEVLGDHKDTDSTLGILANNGGYTASTTAKVSMRCIVKE